MAGLQGSCSCGTSHFTLSRVPTRRFLCHCTICQSVYKAPYADALVTNARTVEVADDSALKMHHLNGDKSIDRGICEQCGEPTIGFMKLLPGMTLAFVPALTVKGASDLPGPGLHIFYESRVADVSDNLPKHLTPGQSMRACLWPFLAGFAGF
ncbi:MAG: GFA family protein [Altererythrobacter ishigakiensis]|jgi:hypothetical protein|nr:GFA family protein [Altererythrobacter ishigakiensis]